MSSGGQARPDARHRRQQRAGVVVGWPRQHIARRCPARRWRRRASPPRVGDVLDDADVVRDEQVAQRRCRAAVRAAGSGSAPAPTRPAPKSARRRRSAWAAPPARARWRCAGAGRRKTRAESARARRGAGRPFGQASRCARGARRASMSGCSACKPSSSISNTRMRGFSDANGSWKMIWMSRRARQQRVAVQLEQVAAVQQRLPLDRAPGRAAVARSPCRWSSCRSPIRRPAPASAPARHLEATRRRPPRSCRCARCSRPLPDREAHAQVLHLAAAAPGRRRRCGRHGVPVVRRATAPARRAARRGPPSGAYSRQRTWRAAPCSDQLRQRARAVRHRLRAARREAAALELGATAAAPCRRWPPAAGRAAPASGSARSSARA